MPAIATVFIPTDLKDAYNEAVPAGDAATFRSLVVAKLMAFGQDADFFAFYRTLQAYQASFGATDTRLVLSPTSDFFRFFNNPVGTSGAVFGGFQPTVAGKTGTAEAATATNPYDHSWYASWAPYDHPKLVVVVMVEHGGFGAQAAAPTAKKIYEAYFHSKSS